VAVVVAMVGVVSFGLNLIGVNLLVSGLHSTLGVGAG
jgi:ABC-type transport system involved in cytochrome c biogenesis permease subunit